MVFRQLSLEETLARQQSPLRHQVFNVSGIPDSILYLTYLGFRREQLRRVHTPGYDTIPVFLWAQYEGTLDFVLRHGRCPVITNFNEWEIGRRASAIRWQLPRGQFLGTWDERRNSQNTGTCSPERSASPSCPRTALDTPSSEDSFPSLW